MRNSLSLRILTGLALAAALVAFSWPGGVQAAAPQHPAGGLRMSGHLQVATETPTDTAIPSPTEAPTATPVPTLPPSTATPMPTLSPSPATPAPAVTQVIPTATQMVANSRPLVVVSGYYLDQDTIQVGNSFKLFLELHNKGEQDANNLILSFLNDSFLPQETGGVVALGSLGKDGKQNVSQRFLVSAALAGIGVGTIPVNLTYTDANGGSYSETFSITLQLRVYSGAAVPTATPTQAQVQRPQLVIAGYQTDTDPLQPGTQFSLAMDVSNLGNADARAVTLVLGGGVTADPSGTPVAGGVSGGSGDLTNFAPLGSSNLVYLGDLAAGQLSKTSIRLIVNVSANPGAYTLKISFVYTDPKGNRLVDDQVITLLIYQLPSVDVNFYRDPGPIVAGQFTTLPLQVVNLGRKTAVLGNMTVSADGVEIQNNTTLVGSMDPGGFFTLDSSLLPVQAGELNLKVVINYTDDFNEARQIEKTVTLNVEDAPVYDPGTDFPGGGGGEGIPAPVEETLWQKVLRFVKGLVGLDSAPPETNPGIINGPTEGIPPTDSKPIPLPSGGKGG